MAVASPPAVCYHVLCRSLWHAMLWIDTPRISAHRLPTHSSSSSSRSGSLHAQLSIDGNEQITLNHYRRMGAKLENKICQQA